MKSSISTRKKVFISYSHKDARYLHQLVEHLAYYERNNLIEFWSDEKITAGAQWRDEIKRATACTKVAVLLISPSFLASEFIAENELPPLLHAAEEEGAIILPVIVRPSNFEDTELASFQAVNSPSMPVAKMRGYQRDAFWAKVVRDIKNAVIPQQEANSNREELVEDPLVLKGAEKTEEAMHEIATGKLRLNGSGSDTRIVNLKAGLAVFRFKYKGRGSPFCGLYNEDNRLLHRLYSSLFDMPGTETQKAVKIKTDGAYFLRVQVASGSWEVEIEQERKAREHSVLNEQREGLMRSGRRIVRPSYEAIFDEYRAMQQYEKENKHGE